MPTLKLTNLLAYKNYFADLATKHVDINGFKWGDLNVVRNDNLSDVADTFLWVMPYNSGRYADTYSDNLVKVKKARISYLEARNSELFADVDTQYEKCERVIEDLVARLYMDKRGADVAGVWQLIATDMNSFATAPIEHKIGSTVYVGYELTLDFKDNTDLAVDVTKWSDL